MHSATEQCPQAPVWFFYWEIILFESAFSLTRHGRCPGKLTALSPAQAYLTYATSVALGAQTGIEECKFQFAWERWNCPEHAFQFSTHNRLRGGESSRGHTGQGGLGVRGCMTCVCMMKCEGS